MKAYIYILSMVYKQAWLRVTSCLGMVACNY